jgi:trehalose 6-phosphate synthase
MPRSSPPASIETVVRPSRSAGIRIAVAPGPAQRLVVVSNRIAVEAPGSKGAQGGLAVAVLAALRSTGGIWFGWSGEVTDKPAAAPELIQGDGLVYATLDLLRQDFEQYYNGFANRVLWPLLHYRPSLVEFQRSDFSAYMRVNRQFAHHLAPLLKPTDFVWVHDYHLMPLGEELRQVGVTQPIGFFLHTPFPAAEVFRVLPIHSKIMRAMCSYDLIGFQTEDDLHNFCDYLRRWSGAEIGRDGAIRVFGRHLRAAVFPIGIDVEAIAGQAEQSVGGRHARRLYESLHERSLIIGVDRLDYSKGLEPRFRAFERLLEMYPEARGRVTLMQIAPPTRSDVPEYLEIRRSLEEAAGHINGRFAEFDWMPLRYLNKTFNQRTLCGFLRAARVGLVTPMRDGMNLVAKEYVAAQDPQNPGALVLSSFAGAARELTDALLVNPIDIDGMAEAMHDALVMPLGERLERWQSMMTVLRRNSIGAWRENFVQALAEAAAAH